MTNPISAHRPARLILGLLLALCASLLMMAQSAGAHGVVVDEEPLNTSVQHPVECDAGFADVYPCMNVDLVEFVPRTVYGGARTNDIWGWTDPETGLEYVILGIRDGTAFFELNDHGHPTYLGRLPTRTSNSIWRDMKTYRNHVFVVSEARGHGMQVFDLTRLRDISQPPVIFSSDRIYRRFGSAHNIAINEDTGYAYAVGVRGELGCAGGLHMIDIEDPLDPKFAGCFGADRYTHDAQCVIYHGPDEDYVDHEICFNSNVDTLTIVDVTNKASPVVLSRSPYPQSRYAHQGWLTEDHEFFLLGDELDEVRLGVRTRTVVWQVANLRLPVRRGEHLSESTAIDHNQYVLGSHVFQANYRSGVRILRIGDLREAELVEVAFFDTVPADDDPSFSGAWSVYPYFESGFIAASDMNSGLFILKPDLAAIPECDDGIDNDGDGLRDYPGDLTCSAIASASESVRETLGVCELKIKKDKAESLVFETFNTDESLDASWNELFGVDPPTTSGSFVTLQANQTITWKAGWLKMGGVMKLEIKKDKKTDLKKIKIRFQKGRKQSGGIAFIAGTGGVDPNLADGGWHEVRIKNMDHVTVTFDGIAVTGFLKELRVKLDKTSTTDAPVVKDFKIELLGRTTATERSRGRVSSVEVEIPATTVRALAGIDYQEKVKQKPEALGGHTEATYRRGKRAASEGIDLAALADDANHQLKERRGACTVVIAP